MERVRVLSTKKLQPNQRQFLLNAGFGVIEADFIQVRHKSFLPNDIKPNLIFTSQSAVYSFLQNGDASGWKHHPVFCVGNKTKEAIEKAGFSVAAFAEYAEDLATKIIAGYEAEQFTFFSGNLRRDTLPKALSDAGIILNEIQVYETVLTPVKVINKVDAVLFFSPSGVESYLKANDLGEIYCFCIGTTTAEALEGKTNNIVIAHKPGVENVIVKCINYYKDHPAKL